MRTLHIRVAGVSYEGRQAYLARLTGKEPVRLVPEPENPYDSNAIAVHVAVEGKVLHCGFIPREMAAQIAFLLDGESVDCSIECVTGGFVMNDGNTAAYGLRLSVQLPDANDFMAQNAP